MRFIESLPFPIKAWCQRDQHFFVSPTTCAQWKKSFSAFSSEVASSLTSGAGSSSSSGAGSSSSSGLTGGPSNTLFETDISPESVELAKLIATDTHPALHYPEWIETQRLSTSDIENLIAMHPKLKRGVLLCAFKHQRSINWAQYSDDAEVNDIAWLARACRGEAVLDHLKQQISQDAYSLHAAVVWWLIHPDALSDILNKIPDPESKLKLCVIVGDLKLFTEHAPLLMQCDLKLARECVTALLNIHPEVRPGMQEAGKVQGQMLDVNALRKFIEHQFDTAVPTLWGKPKTTEQVDFIAREAGGGFAQYCQLMQGVNHARHQ